MGILLLVVLLILLLGGLPRAGLHQHGYGPSGILFVILIVVLILTVVGPIPWGAPRW